MVVQRNLILERHNQIVNYNGHVSTPKTTGIVFEAFITSDERYFVMNDHVIDIQEKTNLGYIWESIDIFKTIFSNVKDDSEEFGTLKESILSLPLIENEKQNLYELRDFFLEEGFFDDTWLGRNLKSAGKGISDSYESAKKMMNKFGTTISNSQYAEVIRSIGRGVLWVLRKFKAAAYSTVGIIVDAILIATGVGKVAQAVFWGLVTGLDIYQIASGDWEPAGTPDWIKWLDLLCDIIGLLGAGIAAKGARGLVKGIKSVTELPKFVRGNKALMNVITTIKGGVTSVMGTIKKALTGLKGKWKPLDTFIDKILSMANRVFTSLKNFVMKMFPETGKLTTKQKLVRGTKAGATAGGLMYGIEKVGDTINGGDKDSSVDDVFNNLDVSKLDIDPSEF